MAERHTPETDARLLIEGLLEQKACYEEMLSLAEEQEGRLLPEAADALLALVQKKQRILTRLDAAAGRMAPARERWAQTRGTVAAELRAEVERTADEVGAVLTRLIAAEEEAARMAGALRDETLARLKAGMETQRLREAYRPRGGDPHLLDRKDV